MATLISSVDEFNSESSKIKPGPSGRLFYRGHSDVKFKLEPSLFRFPRWRIHEHAMYWALLAARPADFEGDRTTLEILVRMQHHKLPTRLLDVTTNPQMALYFACNERAKRRVNGEVIAFAVQEESIRYFDSHLACRIANLAKLAHGWKKNLDLTVDSATFMASEPGKNLWDYIREDRPYFHNPIDPPQLGRILCIRSKMNNSNIVAQAGAFLLFGHKAELDESGKHGITYTKIEVNAKSKTEILKELDRLNINESTVFPGIEHSAEYIAATHKLIRSIPWTPGRT
jgi:hypothetical protein